MMYHLINYLVGKENYIWINIIENNKKCKNKFQDNKNLWITHYEDNQFFLEIDEIKSNCEKFSFLFIKDKEIYKFLGLYQLKEKESTENGVIATYRKYNKDNICLNKLTISNILKENMKDYLEKQNDFGENYNNCEIYDDKIFAINKIKEDFLNINYVNDKLLHDKEIINTYWKSLENTMIKEDFFDFLKTCSIIGADDFGNGIITEFLKNEKERQFKEDIQQYNELLEPIRFSKLVKYIDNSLGYPMTIIDFNIEPFNKFISQLIVFIGEKENELIRKMKKEYQEDWYDIEDNEQKSSVCFLEIYTQDLETNNCKIITKDKNEIFGLLQLITYVTFSLFDGLNYITYLLKDRIKNKQIKLYKFHGKINDIIEQSEKALKYIINEIFFIQLICNAKYDSYTRLQVINKIINIIETKQKISYADYTCNIEEIEVIILTC